MQYVVAHTESTLIALVTVPVVYSLLHPDPKANRKWCDRKPRLKTDLLAKKKKEM
jgi:hypothetical protein